MVPLQTMSLENLLPECKYFCIPPPPKKKDPLRTQNCDIPDGTINSHIRREPDATSPAHHAKPCPLSLHQWPSPDKHPKTEGPEQHAGHCHTPSLAFRHPPSTEVLGVRVMELLPHTLSIGSPHPSGKRGRLSAWSWCDTVTRFTSAYSLYLVYASLSYSNFQHRGH